MGQCCSRKKSFKRLPQNVIPSHYKITIKPNLDACRFSGSEQITIEIKERTKVIVLNSLDLKIQNTHLTLFDGQVVKSNSVSIDKRRETLTIKFKNKLPIGVAELYAEFSGVLNDSMLGFYHSKQIGKNGQEKSCAVTQFEPTYARKAFPCWDEPAIKSTFDINLIVPKHLVALSNMPMKSKSPFYEDESLTFNVYETSPIMSTYLVAFVVGEFEFLETKSADGVLVRIYTPLGKKSEGQFALQVAARCLPYYKEYFGIAYPLPKFDLVAIADFSAGAMENWGLSTFRESCLLVDESERRRQYVAIIVAHEIAHQWFGNLVTMEWWTHLWLNEGYATFEEYMCVDHLFPDYEIWTQFVTDTHNRALQLDALSSSHPIEVKVNHPDEIQEIFDDISYSKGGSVIRMLHHFLGDTVFKKGMNLYLTQNQYKNALTSDLWDALEEASGIEVDKIMSTWTRQMGYPLIHVEKVETEGNERVLTISQQKFWADPLKKSSFSEFKWIVPLTFSSISGELQSELLEKERTTVRLNVSQKDWIKLNPGSFGFYRVLYPTNILNEFIPAIKSKEMPPLDRLGLLDDVFAFVKSGKASTVDALKLIEAYKDEDNYTVWLNISTIFSRLNSLLDYSSSQENLKKYGLTIFEGVKKKVGWTPESKEGHMQALLRSLVIRSMVSFGDENTINEGVEKFSRFEKGKEEIKPDLRSSVYRSILITREDQATLDKMLQMYQVANTNSQEQDNISNALGVIKKKELVEKVLKFSISPQVRKSDTAYMISAISQSKTGRELAWDFFKSNWKHFKGNHLGQHVSGLIKGIIEGFASEEKATEVEKFFKKHDFPATERSVQQAVEQIRLNEKWLLRDEKEIEGFLKNYI